MPDRTRYRRTALKTNLARAGARWNISVSHVLTLDPRDRQRLMVAVSVAEDGDWTAVAATTPESTDSAEKFLDQHAHHLVGSFRSLREALEAAEGYAKAWLANKLPPAADCACDEISARSTRRRTARPRASGRTSKRPSARRAG